MVREHPSNKHQAVKSDPPFEYVIHTASPYKTKWDDPIKDCLDPAIKGTTGILKSIHAYAPTVKRVVITSSSAAVLKRENHPKSYDESSWSEVTEEQALDGKNTYRASKVSMDFILLTWQRKLILPPPEICRTRSVGFQSQGVAVVRPGHD